jgi:quinol monooxygenase YgiN
MTEGPIILTVHFEAVPGREEDLARELVALVEPTLKEAGCLAYELHVDPENHGKFMFFEKFADQAALDFHVNTSHFKKFLSSREKSDPFAGQTITRWKSLGSWHPAVTAVCG